MRFKSLSYENKRPVITVEYRSWFWWKERQYMAVSNIVGRYYRWVEWPSGLHTPDAVSFQLDTWLEMNK
jgi:hypothetical protein